MRQLFKWANDRVATGHTVTKKGFNYYEDLAYFPHEIYWPHFVQQLKSGKAYEIRDDMKHWPVLFLDDVGAERDPSGFAADELNTLLGCRMSKWTLITSNSTIERFSEIDERISSRLIRPPNVCVSVQTIDYSLRQL